MNIFNRIANLFRRRPKRDLPTQEERDTLKKDIENFKRQRELLLWLQQRPHINKEDKSE